MQRLHRACLLAIVSAQTAPALDLTPGAIVVSFDATAAERHAAAELADHFTRIAGTAFPITNAAPSAVTTIVLREDPLLGPEQYRLKASPGTRRLIVTGGRPRGVLYGVYGLLADHFDCRWFTPEFTHLPPRTRLLVPDELDETSAPRFEYREVFWTEAFDGDWAARNRLNSSHARLQPHHGGKISYGPFVHTFERILPVAQHFDAHPEYYAMINGTRVRERTQLCLSHPEVLSHAIAAVRRWIAEQPTASIFSVSQNDWLNPCACPSCKAIDDAEGSHAGSLITFVNAVADAIAKDHPQVAIDTLAYQYTRKPPKTVRPRPNVIVRLCSIECCFAHPLDGCPEPSNTSFVEDLRGWSRLTDRLYVWDYTTDFAHYLLPFPNLGVLDQNLRTCAANGVAGVFEQGAYSKGGGGELAELRSWVLAQLLWNPQRDGASLIREFVHGVYGTAAPAVQRYLDLRAAALQRAGNHVRIYAGPHRPDLLPVDVAAWRAALDEAQVLAGNDAALRARIRRLQMPVWYAQVARGPSPAGTLRTAASNLAAAAIAEHLTDFREASRGVQVELEQLAIDQLRRDHPTAPAGLVVIDDQRFNLHRPGDLTERVADPAADDGVAARLVGRTTEWAVMWVHRGDPDVPPGRYRIASRMRVEATGTNGAAFHLGVYDTNTRKSLGERRVQAADAPASYTNEPIQEADLREGVEVYIAPDDNPANIRALFIDHLALEPLPAEDPMIALPPPAPIP